MIAMPKSTLCLALVWLLSFVASTRADITAGQVTLDAKSLEPGTKIDLTGQWLFKPTYAIKPGDKPESSAAADGFVKVPVPSLLSRIQWWLDDSEDFKKWEQARLDALGFDTEKSDDGWYRLSIDAPTDLPKDRHVFIEFDGVAMRSRTFLNGTELGHHDGMFSRFSYDLTPLLKPGQNTLAVWVGMEKIPPQTLDMGEAVTVNLTASKVLSMSKGMFGPLSPGQPNRAYDLYGIWQPVKLVVRGPAEINDVHFMSTLDSCVIEVTARTLVEPATGSLRMKLTDKKTGTELVSRTFRDVAHLKTDDAIWALDASNLKPNLWTPANPNLYTLFVDLIVNDRVADHWAGDVGFRTFEVKGSQLLLNGHPYFLRGANQAPYGKNPFSPELARKTVQSYHDHNIRFTRTHATPWNEAWLDAADEIGLLVSIEGIRPWAFAGTKTPPTPKDLMDHWLMENADVVKRIRNHPSVVLWTVGNEMLIRSAEDVEKWKQLDQVTKQTRQLDPTRPVIISSSYVRDTKTYEKIVKPHKFDDGDIDDVHKYSGWYSDSPFVIDSKFEKEANKGRPFIGQEMATGYPDLDQGYPVWRYTRDLATPLAWVGQWSYPGADLKVWQDHLSVVTKRWAEQLRYQRGDRTSGFALFSTETWYHHSYDPKTISPYPVMEAVKAAYAPVGLALETNQRRFYAGETFSTNVFITNDDEQARDFKNLTLLASLHRAGTEVQGRPADATVSITVSELAYYGTKQVRLDLRLPVAIGGRMPFNLVLVLLDQDGKELSGTSDLIELFVKPTPGAERSDVPDSFVVLKRGAPLSDLAEGKPLRQKIESGVTAIVFSPGRDLYTLFPNDLIAPKPASRPTASQSGPAEQRSTTVDYCEYADPSPILGTPLGQGLQPTDLKWWARPNDWRAYIGSQSHRLNPKGRARSLVDFVPTHSYIAKERLPEQFKTMLFEIPLGKGRMWICDLDVEACATTDPAAALFLKNLYTAAADPDSTKTIHQLPTHAERVQQEEARRR